MKFTFLLFFFSLALTHVHAQKKTIAGIVTNAENEALTGASIVLISSGLSTTTDSKGRFNLAADKDTARIAISFVGYKSIEIVATAGQAITIQLEEEINTLGEVILVGYGTQKKINLTGAVATVSGKELVKRPAPNVTNLLQGRVAGLDIRQNSGQPGLGSSDILVRGRGTFTGSSAPLILVDGVAVTSLNNLAPEDIADVTVLKDAASASIYGSRAANGVILVSTKQGVKGKSVMEYSTSIGTSSATVLPDLVYHSATYMQMLNDARARRGLGAIYTQPQIEAYRNATDNIQYPNFNWLDFAFKNSTIMNHRLGFSGGTEKTTYNLSFNYLTQDGILPKNDYKRYNVLLNLSTKVNKRVTVGGTVNMSYEDIIQPWLSNQDLVLLIYHGGPTYGAYLPDGSGRIAVGAYRPESGQRSFTSVINNGGQTYKDYTVNAQAFVNVDLVKGLQWQTKGAIAFYNREYRNRQFEVPQYLYQPNANGEYEFFDNSGSNFLGLQQQMSQSVTKTLYSTLTYNTTVADDHNIKALAGYEQIDNRSPFLSGMRTGFPNSALSEINAGLPVNQSTAGNTQEWALQSFFGRVNYDYKEKYLLEANLRYDGSSRIAPANRWNLYNGISAGWRLSEEEFVQNTLPFLSDLKLRASVGTLGNQEIGNNYAFQDILSTTTYPFAGSLTPGAIKTRLVDPNLRWEDTKISNLGLDLVIQRGLFSASVDWYTKKTSGIITQRFDVPASMGLSAPISNIGSMENYGWEFELGHQNRIGKFSYGVNARLSAYKNKVTNVLARSVGNLGGSAGGPDLLTEIGLPFQSFYLYEWVGVFQNQAEIDNWAKQPNSGVLKPGDLKIADRNGNGTVGPEDRMTISPFPKFTYSFGFNAAWKGFALSAFFQGVEGQNMFLKGWGVDPFIQNSPPPAKFLNAWSPSNPTNKVPAVYYSWDYAGVAGYPSTYYMNDLSYLRLKNLYLSYTIPKKIADRISSKGLTLYVSGDNLITFTNFEGADPERGIDNTRFATFPQVKILTAGANIKF
ncbi:SusC/RagA family TonB-linked outer membrane protein [Flavihumibacter sp. UBA7668]|uniref:SusC/RagA family TonB-linked outer membrane protein n=1 Tax=Flavihumibacter sp. UBA7668 TaxID=1946542 RepID=UPI0025B98456|nr:TonB-dependent receptor [Flavihumibacter sp. UBA7668]